MSWIAWIYPKSWYRANEINRINREKLISSLSVGRRFGKTRLTSIEVSTFIGGDGETPPSFRRGMNHLSS